MCDFFFFFLSPERIGVTGFEEEDFCSPNANDGSMYAFFHVKLNNEIVYLFYFVIILYRRVVVKKRKVYALTEGFKVIFKINVSLSTAKCVLHI